MGQVEQVSRQASPPEAVASALEAGWERAWAARGDEAREFFLSLTGRDVRIRILGESLVDGLLPPLEHLRLGKPTDDDPDLTIDVWDRGTVGSDTQADIAVGSTPLWQASADGRVVAYRQPDSVATLDRASHRIVAAYDREPSLASRGRPFNYPLQLWPADRRVQVLHAGLVDREGHGVLLGGAGGSGKSTAALACLQAGFGYLGDDHVGVAANGESRNTGHSIFNSAYFEPAYLRRAFPEIGEVVSGELPGEDKVLLLPSSRFANRMTRSASIRALVLPRAAHLPHAQITPARKAAALLRLAPSSLLASPQAHRDGLDDIAALVDAIPCYWLDLGGDPMEIPPLVDEILSTTMNG